ncbi:MAG: response regulator [Myxococcota bacterium]|nr:response regulator [Myxococcota bacterium]
MTEPQARILIADDNPVVRRVLSQAVTGQGHHATEVEDGQRALELLDEQRFDLVLLDLQMPKINGFDVLLSLKQSGRLRHLPVIVISAIDDVESISFCIQNGATDHVTKPFNPLLLKVRIDACLARKRLLDREKLHLKEMERHSRELEARVREQVEEITAAQFATIMALAKLAESRDAETGGHLERIREYSRLIAVELQARGVHPSLLDDAFIANLYAASALHDIGKVGIPDQILLKPGKLDPDEFAIMQQHTMIGARTLRMVQAQYPQNGFIALGIEIAESHHERWDGSGYPHRLQGEQIPLAGRILAIADVYDALTSRRVYKDAFSHEISRTIILEGRGKHFDPEVVDAFEARQHAFREISLSRSGNSDIWPVLSPFSEAGQAMSAVPMRLSDECGETSSKHKVRAS